MRAPFHLSISPRLASLAVVLLFLALAAHQAAEPLHLDAMDFPAVAQATAESGKPVYYRGEDAPHHSGLYHPPLYIYALAGWFKVVGPGPGPARYFGALCALAFGWATLLLAGTLFPRAAVERYAPWFWACFLLNPFTLQSSAVPDIDTSVYGPLLTLLLWSVVRLSWREGERREGPRELRALLPVAAFLALCLWAKLTTVLAYLPFLPFLLPAEWRWGRRLGATAFAVAAGTALFLATFFLYGRLLHLDVTYTFDFLVASFSGRGHLPNPLANLKVMGLHVMRWTGFLPWAALAFSFAVCAWGAFRRRGPKEHTLAVLLLLHGAVVVYYCARTLTFGNAPFKYVFVSCGVVAAALASLAAASAAEGAGRGGGAPASGVPLAALLLALAGAAAGLYAGTRVVRDTVIQYGWTTRRWELLFALPLALAAAGLALRATRRHGWPTFGRLLVRTALGLHLGLAAGIAAYQSTQLYAKSYDYGQGGLAETGAFLHQRLAPAERISAMKDVGFLADCRYFENYFAIVNPDQALRLVRRWEEGEVRYIVFTEGIGQDQTVVQPVLREWLAAHGELVASFGHYRIYQPAIDPLHGASPREPAAPPATHP